MTKQLGVYIHIPFCNGKCAYCDFVSGKYPESTQEAYFNMLEKEIQDFDFSGYETDTVYFGGGTPSSVPADYINRILDTLRSKTKLAENCEITIECNPESLTESSAKEYAKLGINRISIGLQSDNDKLLAAIGRLHDKAGFTRAVTAAKKYFNNISVDLILGLPNQTTDDVRGSVLTAMSHANHVSVYALKVEEGTPLAASGYVTDEDRTADLYDLATEMLTERGYKRYEVSNFAVPGSESRHNKKYWSLDDYVGFGVAAHSYLSGSRLENTPDITAYLDGTRTTHSHLIPRGSSEDMEEFIMLALRTEDGIDLTEFEKRFGFRLEERKSGEISNINSLISIKSDRLTLTGKGFYLMNAIIVKLINE